MIKFNKKIIGFLSVLPILYIGYQYYNYSKYHCSNFINLSDEAIIPVLNYWNQIENGDLSNPKNFKKMDIWVRKNYYIFQKNRKLLESGYNIKYDKGSGFYLFVLYGQDHKVSNQNISIPNIDYNYSFSKEQPSFINYLIQDKDYDIVLFAFKKKN